MDVVRLSVRVSKMCWFTIRTDRSLERQSRSFPTILSSDPRIVIVLRMKIGTVTSVRVRTLVC